MQLLNPSALLVLGLIPILILIHSLKPKPKQVEVTNLFLWRAALKEKKGGVRVQRLITNLPLLLQILAVILAALALSKPVWSYSTQIKGDVILVLDSSASMKTITGSGIRFDQARQEALKLVRELPKDSRMLIIEAGHKPKLKAAFSKDKKHLKRTIEEIQPSDAPGQIEKAVYLALSFMNPERDNWTFLITDGAGGDFEKLTNINPKVKPILITGGKRNVGITKFEFRPEPEFEDRYEIMVEITNFNPNPVLCPFSLSLDEQTIFKKVIGLKKLEKKLLILPYSGLIAGTAQATLDLKDDFPIDNKAYTVLNSSKKIWVLLVTRGNYFLEKLLAAYPNFMVNSVKEIIPSSWPVQAERHDIVILDRISPPSTEKGNFLLIDSFSPSIPLHKIGQINNPEVLDWAHGNPLMASLNLSGLNIEEAVKVKADNSMRPLMEARQTGLMYSYQKSGLRAVFLGFGLTDSDLPLRVAFPVMMSNIFQWLYPNKLKVSSRQITAGDPFTVELESKRKEFSIRTPSGKWIKYKNEISPFRYTNTGEVGIYSVIEGEKWSDFAVNLLNEKESDIHGFTPPATDQAASETSATEPVTAELALWALFLLTASASLIVEWYFWLRSR
ncbi:MAG: VWA domain-containing protein [Deltaproteobacteria bacterium]|nr:VWA domain-containing protein [Deltaproteobacteria bacterium]MBW2140872.1 VWA domain-containing protein [Deltaproteobacteria bacterium]MBW2322984.1 VWA domain-containing protein [Deltaproteobacteria bacterium]